MAFPPIFRGQLRESFPTVFDSDDKVRGWGCDLERRDTCDEA